jgi:DNA-binding MarR family transcriptional regulator
VQIRRDQILLGVPAMELRRLMRTWNWCEAGVPLIRKELGLTKAPASELLERLVAEGYVEEERQIRAAGEDRYVLTVKGCALASASAAAPIRRELAQRRLHELIERMVFANADERFHLGVQEAAVFGSYLTDAPTVGDVDVHYVTYRKIQDGAEYMREATRAARASGRRFSSYLDFVSWPEAELYRFLKNRSRVYGLADNSQLLADPNVQRVTILYNRAPVSNWRSL